MQSRSLTPTVPFFLVGHDYFSIRGRRTPWANNLTCTSFKTIACDCEAKERFCEQIPVGEITGETEKGSIWPDCLGGVRGGCAGLPVSKNVWSVIATKKVCDFNWINIEIKRMRNSKLVLADQPSYRMIVPDPAADLDIEGSFLDPSICNKWWKVKNVRFDNRRIWKIIPETWNGADLFTLRKFVRGAVVCTSVFIELAREHRWTNFKFIPALLPQDDRYTSYRGVDYLGKKWPPREFDPEFDASKWTPEMDKR